MFALLLIQTVMFQFGDLAQSRLFLAALLAGFRFRPFRLSFRLFRRVLVLATHMTRCLHISQVVRHLELLWVKKGFYLSIFKKFSVARIINVLLFMQNLLLFSLFPNLFSPFNCVQPSFFLFVVNQICLWVKNSRSFLLLFLLLVCIHFWLFVKQVFKSVAVVVGSWSARHSQSLICILSDLFWIRLVYLGLLHDFFVYFFIITGKFVSIFQQVLFFQKCVLFLESLHFQFILVSFTFFKLPFRFSLFGALCDWFLQFVQFRRNCLWSLVNVNSSSLGRITLWFHILTWWLFRASHFWTLISLFPYRVISNKTFTFSLICAFFIRAWKLGFILMKIFLNKVSKWDHLLSLFSLNHDIKCATSTNLRIIKSFVADFSLQILRIEHIMRLSSNNFILFSQ